ncbi:pectate lyase-like [Andrographis paniculata]|uniref:pectate lyase-like n=1 Tax=Andrographis paniculata TaxID=175694 RepID=UPI0021E79B62|nr:pectate lyase-like [Andrographis paniculata]
MDAINRIAWFVAVVFTICSCNANPNPNSNPNYDVVWRRRAEEAKRRALEAYEPNPLSVVEHLNKKVHMSIRGGNTTTTTTTTRRSLKGKPPGGGGGCEATNPIDQCWRCQPNWAQNRRRLADCGLGFGRRATGGKAGKIYVVTDPSDADMVNPKIGTLRHAVIQLEPLWIVFARSMVIRLSEELIMTSDKTIDGRGAQIHITNGAGLTLQHIHNVIIHNIRLHDIKVGQGGMIRDSTSHFGLRTRSDGDGISVFGSTDVWIDHVSLSNCADGLIDVIEGSTAVTISNCHFTHHNDVLLFGASDTYSADKIMQVTLAFNHFGKGLIQRMPRLRWGYVHIVNNDYTMWEMYAIGGSQQPTILSQGNRFYAPQNPFAKEITKREYTPESVWKSWVWKSEGDLLMNGAFFVPSGDPNHKFPMEPATIGPRGGEMASRLSQYAGPLTCFENKPC